MATAELAVTAFPHLYVHLPAGAPGPGRALDAISREVAMRRARGELPDALETVGVGGDGVGAFGARLGPSLRSTLAPFGVERAGEWTLEVDPGAVTGRTLKAWREAGITRVTLGVGSLRDPARAWLGREPDGKRVREMMERVRDAGFASWGVDLLFGLPYRVDPDPVPSLEATIEIGAPHVSLYEWKAEPEAAGVEPAAEVFPETRSSRDADEDLRADQYLAMARRLEAAGLEGYEMMSFARAGDRSRHLTAILDGASCLGIGPGAHTRAGDRRSWNLRDWSAYLTAVEENRIPRGGFERPDPAALRLETLWAGLRRREGIAVGELGDPSLELGARWVQWGLARIEADRLRLTLDGWLRLDELAVELARTEASGPEPPPGRGRWEE